MKSDLDRRLLVFVTTDPTRVLQLAIATGMAIGQELVHRGKLGELHKLGQNEALCLSACAAVLEQWVTASRAGGMNEADFRDLVNRIERIARAS